MVQIIMARLLIRQGAAVTQWKASNKARKSKARVKGEKMRVKKGQRLADRKGWSITSIIYVISDSAGRRRRFQRLINMFGHGYLAGLKS